MSTIPHGYCHCGCGEKTNLADRTRSALGHVKGEPFKYLVGHNKRVERGPVETRLWAKVERGAPDECWPWLGATTTEGYGRITIDRKTLRAHRVVYELLVGPVPEGLELDHLCRNPSCVNPDHLEPVTQRENVRRIPRERVAHCQHGHLYDEANTYRPPRGERQCRICRREANRRARNRRKTRV